MWNLWHVFLVECNYERARSASEFFPGLREKSQPIYGLESQYARPNTTRHNQTQPDPVSLLRSLYLWYGLTDSRAVFFVRCHHSINFVFDRQRYPPVPATARGTCRVRGCRRHPISSITPWRLARLRSNLVCVYSPAVALPHKINDGFRDNLKGFALSGLKLLQSSS